MMRLAEIAKAEGVEMRVSEGGRHTKVWIGDRCEMVPRHNEVNEITAKKIIGKLERRP